METNPNYTIVGAFVLIFFTFTVLCIIWLSSGFHYAEFTIYQVYMTESVSGLNADAPVEFNGVNVGKVMRIRINHQNPQLVELLLRIKKDTPVTRGTRAKLDIRSLSGQTFMQLEDKGKDMNPLIKAPDAEYPVIATAPSILVRLDSALTQISDSFHQLSESLQALLDKDNLLSIKQTLNHLSSFTNTLDKNKNRIDTIMSKTSNSVQVFENQTLPDTQQVLFNLNQMARNLSKVSNEVKQNPAVLIRGKAQGKLGPGEQ